MEFESTLSKICLILNLKRDNDSEYAATIKFKKFKYIK